MLSATDLLPPYLYELYLFRTATLTSAPFGRSTSIFPHSFRKSFIAAVRIHTTKCSSSRGEPSIAPPPLVAFSSLKCAVACAPNLNSRSLLQLIPRSSTPSAAPFSANAYVSLKKLHAASPHGSIVPTTAPVTGSVRRSCGAH